MAKKLAEVKKTLGSEQKVDRVAEWLTQAHLPALGGYPYDCTIHLGCLFVASLDPGKDYNRTMIEQYDVTLVAQWYDLAAAYLKEERGRVPRWSDDFTDDNFKAWGEAFWETESEAGARA